MTSHSSVTPTGDNTNKRREDYISWDEYFMAIAFLSGQRSKDPVTQVGACIVNEDNIVVGTGYNGMPVGLHDNRMPWGKEPGTDHKKLYVCHAEMNAILNKNSADIKKSRIYVSLFPCNQCAKMIIQSKISEVIYRSDKYHEKDEYKASRIMLEMANVKTRQFIPETITIDFDKIEETRAGVPATEASEAPTEAL